MQLLKARHQAAISGLQRFGICCLKMSHQNQFNIYFVTSRQEWLGIAKPKNVYRLTINSSIKLIWNLKISYLTEFSDWLTSTAA